MQYASLDNTEAASQSDLFALFNVLNVFTPGSDPVIGTQNSELNWGRSGSDTFVGFDPSVSDRSQQQIDVFIGDGSEANFLGSDSNSDWSDRFIFGDWKQPYYVDSNGLDFGFKQFGIILDFNSQQDIIHLHGTSKNYRLLESPIGTAIFWQSDWYAVPDLVTFLPGIYDLHLEADYFRFEGDTPPAGPVEEKIKQLGTSGVELTIAPASDRFGNVYVVGSSSGSLGGSNVGASDIWLAKYDSNGDRQWIQQFGSSSVDAPLEIATDNEGNLYLTGVTKGDLEKTDSESGVYQGWLAKYDSDGNQVWIRQFADNLTDTSFSIDVDDQSNIYLSGFTIEETEGIASFQDDPWIAKYDSDGNQQWYQVFGTSDLDENYGVAVSNDGSVYATGWTVGDLGGNNAGLYDIWLAKHDNNGQQQWIQQFGTQDYEFSWGIDTDSQGNIYLTGWTLGDLEGSNAGSSDTWLAKYDSNGNQVWMQQFGTSGNDSSLCIEIDFNDNIFLAGYTDNDLGGSNAGSADAWVAKYDSDGNQVWIQQFGTPDDDPASKLTVDNTGHVYVTGSTYGSLGSMNAGNYDSWIAKLDTEEGKLQDFTGTSDILDNNDTLLATTTERILSSNFVDSFLTEGIDANDSIDSSSFEDLTSWLLGLIQADNTEVAIADNPLQDFLQTSSFNFADRNFISDNHLF